ncbi:MAG: AbrB/MazE/SpoVT family DNA-binding domain-containing protein, partial [Candidatus Atribacteria bacterium]|nr:AbrB/MazE/SpoVT family DNA-binding domain-containing protein [Candidatus Atribacteria bacterium]
MKGSKVSSKGQVTLPIEARKHLNIQPGVRVRFVLEKNSIRIV